MLIDLLKLPEEGKKLHLVFSEVFCDAFFCVKSFVGDIFKEKNEFILYGELLFEVEEQCDRCLEYFTLSVNDYISLKLTDKLYNVGVVNKPEIRLEDNDLDRLYVDNSIININTLILEEAEALRPMIKLCNDECRGLCEHCGVNMNKYECDCNNLAKAHFSIADLINKYNKLK